MRHTYASNWLAVHGDINKLTLHLGHTRPAMLWQHYHTAVLKKEAAKFWGLHPKNRAAQVDGEAEKNSPPVEGANPH